MSTSYKIPLYLSKANEYIKLGITGKNINIAIIDSGICYHPDIASHRILAFRDFVNHKTIPYDDYSHGTHIAGIIGSQKTGIAPEVCFVGIKVLDEYGNSSIDTFVDGIKWILNHHKAYNIRIVNISIGGNSGELKKTNNRLNDWVQKLWDAGMIVICSAGNKGPKPGSVTAPGNLKDVITVGSSDGRNYSSVGLLSPYITKPEIIAPGTNILSTTPYGGYITKSGTSMSVPFVSGAAALLLHLAPHLTNEEVKMHLMNSATPIDSLPENMQGAGKLNIPNLLKDFL